MVQPIIRAARVIPQDVQRDIAKLNELRLQIASLKGEHDRLGQKIADRLIPAVVGQ
jgi:hypothetical protein